jgi:hypothetical protein
LVTCSPVRAASAGWPHSHPSRRPPGPPTILQLWPRQSRAKATKNGVGHGRSRIGPQLQDRELEVRPAGAGDAHPRKPRPLTPPASGGAVPQRPQCHPSPCTAARCTDLIDPRLPRTIPIVVRVDTVVRLGFRRQPESPVSPVTTSTGIAGSDGRIHNRPAAGALRRPRGPATPTGRSCSAPGWSSAPGR